MSIYGGDVETMAEQLAGHWPGAILMTVQNGIGADAIIARHGDWRLLVSVTFMSGTRHADSHVEYVLDTATWIGPSRGTTPADARRVAALIASSGLKAEAFDDLPPSLRVNVDVVNLPFGRHPGDRPVWSDAEIDDVIAFLKTLDDGYRPP